MGQAAAPDRIVSDRAQQWKKAAPESSEAIDAARWSWESPQPTSRRRLAGSLGRVLVTCWLQWLDADLGVRQSCARARETPSKKPLPYGVFQVAGPSRSKLNKQIKKTYLQMNIIQYTHTYSYTVCGPD